MKIILIIGVLLLSFVPTIRLPASLVADGYNPSYRIKLRIIVNWGCGNDCHPGFCICSLTLETEGAGANQEGNAALADAWIENSRLRVNFIRTSLSGNAGAGFFTDNAFQLENDFVLPEEVAGQLGVASYTIKAGRYPIDPLNSNESFIALEL